jgi:hypothetical protein
VKFRGTVHSSATLSNLWASKKIRSAATLERAERTCVQKVQSSDRRSLACILGCFYITIVSNTLGKESKLFTMVPHKMSSLVPEPDRHK